MVRQQQRMTSGNPTSQSGIGFGDGRAGATLALASHIPGLAGVEPSSEAFNEISVDRTTKIPKNPRIMRVRSRPPPGAEQVIRTGKAGFLVDPDSAVNSAQSWIRANRSG